MDPWQSGIDAVLLLESLSFGAFLIDRNGKLLHVNREAMRILGLRSFAEAADIIEGRKLELQVTQLRTTAPPTTTFWIQRALAGETVTEDLERVEPIDGKPDVIVRASFAPMRNREGEIVGVVKILRDVTLEHDLARRKDEFLRLTTHELRTPAAALRLRAQSLLYQESPTPDHLRESAEAIDRATRRIETLAVKVQDVATVASGQPLSLQPMRLRLDMLVNDVVQSLEPQQAGRIHTRAGPAEVRADAIRIREVVQTLLDNALRYSEPPAPIDVAVGARDGGVELTVTDHGVGIPKAKQPLVFGRFYRAHAGTPIDRGGLGASLYLAEQIVKQHGGRIWFESAERRGTTFHVTFHATG